MKRGISVEGVNLGRRSGIKGVRRWRLNIEAMGSRSSGGGSSSAESVQGTELDGAFWDDWSEDESDKGGEESIGMEQSGIAEGFE